MAQYGFKFQFSAPGASDVAVPGGKRILSVDGVEEEYAGTALKSNEIVKNLGDTVVAKLRDVDASGNASEFGPELTYVVVDNVAPPAPGVFGVIDSRQIDDVPPTP